MRKTTFFELFARCSAKSVRKQYFFHVFWNTLYKVRKKCWKTAFFELFLRRSAKSVRKQCFIHFFLRRSAKSVRKQCFFFTIFETLCTKFAKKSVFFARRFAKSVSVLSRFSRQFVQSLQKISKNSVFWTFYATFRQKCKKTVFFHVFRDTLYKVRDKSLKTEFFLRDVMQRVWENNVLSPFSRHFVQSSQKMRKISVFCATLCKKCEKTVFFSRFLRHFVQSSQKKWKNSVFFARRYAKSMTKQCSFTFFKTLCA